jgi:myosin V
LTSAQSKASGQVKDLLNRLNNAVKQRNAAREEALLASQNLKKLEEDIEVGALQPAPAAAAAAQQPLAATPPATAAGSPMGADSGASASVRMTKLASKPHTLQHSPGP